MTADDLATTRRWADLYGTDDPFMPEARAAQAVLAEFDRLRGEHAVCLALNEQVAARNDSLRAEADRLREDNRALRAWLAYLEARLKAAAERIADQSEALSRAAEKKPCPGPAVPEGRA